MLSESAAKSVVNEIGKLVNKNINIMDINGIIIASTDASRIGQSHWGAEQIILNHLDELYITNEDIHRIDTNHYVQTGLNLPLFVENKVIGVIGITGEYDEVIEIGQIVKKTAEILLEEQAQKQRLATDQRAFEIFIHDYLNFRDLNFSQAFVKQANFYRFNIRVNYVMIAFREDVAHVLMDQSLRDQVTKIAKHQFNYMLSKSIIIEKDHKWLALVPNNMNNANNLENKLKTLCESLQKQLSQELNISFSFGVSSFKNKSLAPYDIWEQADQALLLSNINDVPITNYDDIGLANIIFYLPKLTKEDFLKDFFGELSQEEINDYTRLFEIYYKHEGSITEIADEMFIHSNTVQYRLNKFAKMNGRDIRKVSQSHYFYMATLLVKEKNFTEKMLNL